jgi:flagellar biosynthesis/type III secretory pathway M-ring protein FliF/YscJ
MRLFKLILCFLVIAFIALFIWQNLPTFKTLLPFSLDLYVREQLVWQHFLYTLLLASGLLGLLIGILLMMKPYLRIRRLLHQERQEKQQMKAAQPAPPPVEEPTKES